MYISMHVYTHAPYIYLCVEALLHVCWLILNLPRLELLQIVVGHLESLHARLDEVQVELLSIYTQVGRKKRGPEEGEGEGEKERERGRGGEGAKERGRGRGREKGRGTCAVSMPFTPLFTHTEADHFVPEKKFLPTFLTGQPQVRSSWPFKKECPLDGSYYSCNERQ